MFRSARQRKYRFGFCVCPQMVLSFPDGVGSVFVRAVLFVLEEGSTYDYVGRTTAVVPYSSRLAISWLRLPI